MRLGGWIAWWRRRRELPGGLGLGLEKVWGRLRQRLYPEALRIARPAWLEAETASGEEREAPGAKRAPPDSAGTGAGSGLPPDLRRLICDAATCLLRAQKKMEGLGGKEAPEALVKLLRHVTGACEALKFNGVEVRDHTGERYVDGMALEVLAFQPRPGTDFEVVEETLRPSVYYKDVLIQRGQVIVATPEKRPDGGLTQAPPADLAEQRPVVDGTRAVEPDTINGGE